MRQHKYCMHSIKKIGACRKRKKKKACQQVTSAPRDLLLQGTAAFIICGSRAAARPPASPPRPARSGGRAGEAGSAPGRARGPVPAGAGRGHRRLPVPSAAGSGGPALLVPPRCCLRGEPANRGGGVVWCMGRALSPGSGNRRAGFSTPHNLPRYRALQRGGDAGGGWGLGGWARAL